jgi:hypothetical protein
MRSVSAVHEPFGQHTVSIEPALFGAPTLVKEAGPDAARNSAEKATAEIAMPRARHPVDATYAA